MGRPATVGLAEPGSPPQCPAGVPAAAGRVSRAGLPTAEGAPAEEGCEGLAQASRPASHPAAGSGRR